MFYEPRRGHRLAHDPFSAIIVPRPIGWISTCDPNGIANIAPYSFFNAVAYKPPQVMFASTGNKPDQAQGKDSLANIRQTGVFCVNIVEHGMKDKMNATSTPYPASEDEFMMAGLASAECEMIDCHRVGGVPAALECKAGQIIELSGAGNFVVFGEVVGIHLRDNCVKNGRFDVLAFTPLARLGYQDYTAVTNSFSLERPAR